MVEPLLPTANVPDTILVVHPRENRKKCSIEPLRGQSGFVFWTFPERDELPEGVYFRLGLGGPVLSADDATSGLLLLDGTWRLAEKMEAQYIDLPVRSLLPWRTAYPRVSKIFDDPAAGLATIEALFAALAQMGRPTTGLLQHYRWREEFLRLNADLLASLHLSPTS